MHTQLNSKYLYWFSVKTDNTVLANDMTKHVLICHNYRESKNDDDDDDNKHEIKRDDIYDYNSDEEYVARGFRVTFSM